MAISGKSLHKLEAHRLMRRLIRRQCRAASRLMQRRCALHLHYYEDELQPESSTLDSTIKILRNRAFALHDSLNDRPLPVNDASMLTHQLRMRIVFILSLLTPRTCLAGNLTTFVLLGWTPLGAFFAAFFMTALPLGLGHPAYERLVADNKAQVILILVIAVLSLAAVYEVGQARQAVIDKATAAQSGTTSCVEKGIANDPPSVTTSPDGSEAQVNGQRSKAPRWRVVPHHDSCGAGAWISRGTLRRIRLRRSYKRRLQRAAAPARRCIWYA